MIPSYLGEPLEPPPVSPARGPPADWGEIVQVHDERDGFQAAGGRAARDRQSLAVTPTQPTGRCPDAETIVSAHHRHRLRGADGGEQGIEPTATPPTDSGETDTTKRHHFRPPRAAVFNRRQQHSQARDRQAHDRRGSGLNRRVVSRVRRRNHEQDRNRHVSRERPFLAGL